MLPESGQGYFSLRTVGPWHMQEGEFQHFPDGCPHVRGMSPSHPSGHPFAIPHSHAHSLAPESWLSPVATGQV